MEENKKVREETVEAEMSSFTVLDENGNEVVLYVVDVTKIAGVDYILATDTEEDGGEGLIFKVTPAENEEELLLENVTDEEYDYISKVFAETSDITFEP